VLLTGAGTRKSRRDGRGADSSRDHFPLTDEGLSCFLMINHFERLTLPHETRACAVRATGASSQERVPGGAGVTSGGEDSSRGRFLLTEVAPYCALIINHF